MRREPGVANHPRRIPPKIEKPTTFGCCWPMSETIPSKGARAAMAMKLGSGNSKLHTSESAPTHEVAQGSDTDCVTPGLSGILACGYVSPDRTAFFADLWSRAPGSVRDVHWLRIALKWTANTAGAPTFAFVTCTIAEATAIPSRTTPTAHGRFIDDRRGRHDARWSGWAHTSRSASHRGTENAGISARPLTRSRLGLTRSRHGLEATENTRVLRLVLDSSFDS